MNETRHSGFRIAKAVTAATTVILASLTGCDSGPPDLTEKIPQSPAWQKKFTSETYCTDIRNGAVNYVSGNKITLLDARSGADRWTSADLGKNYSCPLYTPSAVYYGIGTNSVGALNPNTGKALWQQKYDDFGDESRERPCASDSAIHFLVNSTIVTVNPKTRKQEWEHEEQEDMWVDHMTASENTVIITTPNGKVRGLKASDGREIWTYTTPGHARIRKEPLAKGKTVYFSSYDGYAYALSADTGKLEWKTKLGGSTDWYPLLVGGTVFLADDYKLNALDIKDGHIEWKKDYDIYRSGASVGNNLVYFNSEKNRFDGIDPHDGSVAWRLNMKEATLNWFLGDGLLYVNTQSHLNAYKLP
ncbi:PQQ-binding-like beta-propeller repeat protein [Streptomyces sp. NPDC089919]|uniref:outer membrane protein assembly factor BamB family protein n=1 Tax=Streptomyces sp. NPDC089919 TaxID=3155188 RepID=UPI00341D5DC7